MNDKTAIEKALRGLLWLIDQGQLVEKEKSMCGPAIVHHAREALAALDAEKPADDWRVLCDVRSDMMRDCASGQYQDADDRLQSFAASYHAEQCKSCNKWISVKDRLPENCNGVLVFGINESGKSRKAKAMYARKFELEANDEAVDSGFYPVLCVFVIGNRKKTQLIHHE